MSERLRPRDVALLAEESPSTPMHNATVEIFDPGRSGFDYARLVELVQDRITFVPRYRQRILAVPGGSRTRSGSTTPTSTSASTYDAPRCPGRAPSTSSRELVSRIVSRPLDRSRPLWEMYFVEGLADGQVALLSKSHQVLVDGVDTVDLGQVLLDSSPTCASSAATTGVRVRRPSPVLADGRRRARLRDRPRHPHRHLRSTTGSVVRGASGAARTVGRVANALTNRTPSTDSPIIGPLSQQRRVIAVRTDLADHRKVRDALGGTVNDVVLATVTGALRSWLMTRGESMRGVRQVRAVVPVSVIDEELEATSLGSQIAAHFVDLPVWEASPVVRLHQVSYSFQAHRGRRPRRSPAGPARRDRGLRSRRRSTRSGPGSLPTSAAAATSSASPMSPGRSRRSTPLAPGWCRPTRCRRCSRDIRWRSA